MSMSLFNQGSFTGLKTNLEGTSLRHRLITNNIANSQTPSYVARDLNFDSYIKISSDRIPKDKMLTTQNNHIGTDLMGLQNPDSFSRDLTGQLTMMRINTSPEEEMVKMSENSIRHKASLDILSRKYQAYSLAITGMVK